VKKHEKNVGENGGRRAEQSRVEGKQVLQNELPTCKTVRFGAVHMSLPGLPSLSVCSVQSRWATGLLFIALPDFLCGMLLECAVP
jgi:hypothetical protein